MTRTSTQRSANAAVLLLLAASRGALVEPSISAAISATGSVTPAAQLAAYPSEPNFLTIDRSYPGLRVLHREPWIFEVPQFLNKTEAQGLLELCSARMQPSLDSQGVRREGDGWEFQNLRFDPRRVVGWLEERIRRLTGLGFDCVSDATTMHYWAGSGGLPAHADHNHLTFRLKSGRVMTLFIYLNDVSVEATGGTIFDELGLVAQPSFGKLVMFFPGELDGASDFRTRHSGLPTQEEKWLLRFFFHAESVFPVGEPNADGEYDNGFHAFDRGGYHLRQVGKYDEEPPVSWVERFQADREASGD